MPGRPSSLGMTRYPASGLSQPLFKKLTQTHWAKPVETLEEIIATVDIRLPEFSELQDCFREVRSAVGTVWKHTMTSSVSTPHPCVFIHAHTHTRAFTSLYTWVLPWKLQSRGGDEPVRGRCQWVAHSPWPLPAQELMEAVHLHLVKEYIIQLSKRRLVLKTAEQQQQLAKHILVNADAIQHFCTDNVSAPTHPRAWESPIRPFQAWPDASLSLS